MSAILSSMMEVGEAECDMVAPVAETTAVQ
jgi:hypothetical protein